MEPPAGFTPGLHQSRLQSLPSAEGVLPPLTQRFSISGRSYPALSTEVARYGKGSGQPGHSRSIRPSISGLRDRLDDGLFSSKCVHWLGLYPIPFDIVKVATGSRGLETPVAGSDSCQAGGRGFVAVL